MSVREKCDEKSWEECSGRGAGAVTRRTILVTEEESPSVSVDDVPGLMSSH
jgi:hypothetical protein